jgi:hypothetical protein
LDSEWGRDVNDQKLLESPRLVLKKARQVQAVIDYIHNMMWVQTDVPLTIVPAQQNSTTHDAAEVLTMLSSPTTSPTSTSTTAAIPVARTIATSSQSLFNNSVPRVGKRKHHKISKPVEHAHVGLNIR